jgi:hypothetical protein
VSGTQFGGDFQPPVALVHKSRLTASALSNAISEVLPEQFGDDRPHLRHGRRRGFPPEPPPLQDQEPQDQKRECDTAGGDAIVAATNDEILANQDKILANQDKILANQETIQTNQEKLDKVLANQDTILANQETILANQKKMLAK